MVGMKKKPLYYVVLYRPKGSKCWTPVNDCKFIGGKGNFFANKKDAQFWIDWDGLTDENEFAIGKVELV